jgi:hypothetical protein
MSVAALRPSIERQIGEYLERPAAELDELLARIIDFIGTLRSDDAGALIVTTHGAFFTSRHPRTKWFYLGDPVRAPGVGVGDDAERQVDGVAQDVSVGGGAAHGY